MSAANEDFLWHRPQPLRAVLFDLDGTLLDTAEDIAGSLNFALSGLGRYVFSTAQVRDMIGRGVPILIERALQRLGVAPAATERAAIQQRFYDHYQELHDDGEFHARPYPGAAQALEALHARALKLGVVTNKPRDAAVTLLEHCGLSGWLDVIVGGDSCPERKPHPQPLLLALQTLQVEPRHALMVGDSQIDVQTARAAGVTIICVPYGYNEGADSRSLACDAFVETLADLPALLAS